MRADAQNQDVKTGKQEVSTSVQGSRTHVIVVRTEVLEVAEAGVAEADEDGDGQSYQCEQRRGGQEA